MIGEDAGPESYEKSKNQERSEAAERVKTSDKDPWAHRSEGMRCQTCMWYVKKGGGPIISPNSVGRCRRHAPTMSGYPVVFANDWCGDHKLDERR